MSEQTLMLQRMRDHAAAYDNGWPHDSTDAGLLREAADEIERLGRERDEKNALYFEEMSEKNMAVISRDRADAERDGALRALSMTKTALEGRADRAEALLAEARGHIEVLEPLAYWTCAGEYFDDDKQAEHSAIIERARAFLRSTEAPSSGKVGQK